MRMCFMNIGHPSNTFRPFFSMLALGFFATAVASVVSSAQEPGDAPAAAFKRVCSTCHDSDRILATRPDTDAVGRDHREDDRPRRRGHHGGLHDGRRIPASCERTRKRQQGSDQGHVAVLSVTQKDGDAIAEYRKTNGEFKDFDALSKVPGIDLEKLKQGRDAIAF